MQARIALVEGEARPDILELDPDRAISIGRSRDNSIVLPREEHASRLHARVYFEDGRWLLRDFGMNGTRLDECRVNQVAELADGTEIRIGSVRFRFALNDPNRSASKATSSTRILSNSPQPAAADPKSIPIARFAVDEWTALHQFAQAAFEDVTPEELIRQAVQTIFYHSGAATAGAFSLDPSSPLPRYVWPESAVIEEAVTRQLTRRVQRDDRLVWIAEDTAGATVPLTAGFPGSFADAMAIPVKSRGCTWVAIHLYKSNGHFSDGARKFAEAIASLAGKAMASLMAKRSNRADAYRLRAPGSTDDLLGASAAIGSLRAQLVRAMGHPRPILIRGEIGTGKLTAARSAHSNGPRSHYPFVVVRCGTMPASLVEGELFGYRKGAFSGADRDHLGLAALADGGVLYIDEIADLPEDCHAPLIRLVKERAYRSLGATYDARADVKLVVSTRHTELPHALEELFLEPEIVVPPLRERPDDIPVLAQVFVDRIGAEWRRDWTLTSDAVSYLCSRPWPGNARQLRAQLEAAAIHALGDEIDVSDLIAVDRPSRA